MRLFPRENGGNGVESLTQSQICVFISYGSYLHKIPRAFSVGLPLGQGPCPQAFACHLGGSGEKRKGVHEYQ